MRKVVISETSKKAFRLTLVVYENNATKSSFEGPKFSQLHRLCCWNLNELEEEDDEDEGATIY